MRTGAFLTVQREALGSKLTESLEEQFREAGNELSFNIAASSIELMFPTHEDEALGSSSREDADDSSFEFSEAMAELYA